MINERLSRKEKPIVMFEKNVNNFFTFSQK